MHPHRNDGENDSTARGHAIVAWAKSMPTPSKPCPGELSQEIQQFLSRTSGQAQLDTYPCELCGRVVGVEKTGGHWIPERHLSSVAYASRKGQVSRIRA
jgi:hypothetical protein